MDELITVVIPVYNVEKYIDRCIRSVLNQSYKNLEIILVDDGSTDSSGDICDKYANVDSRIKVIHKTNGGLSDARNAGIKITRSKYITFLDSDDYLKFDYIEALYKMLVSNNADISIVRYKRVYDSSYSCERYNEENIEIMDGKEALETMLYHTNLISQSAYAKMYKTELFEGIEYPYGRLHEDIGTTYKLFLKSNKIVFSKNQYYYYYQRRDGIVHSDFNLKKMDAVYLSEDLMGYIMANIPDLTKAAVFYTFSQNIQVLLKIPLNDIKYKSEVDYIRNNICEKRWIVIKDKNVSVGKKVGALSTIMGLRMTKVMAIIYKRLVNNEVA